MTNPSPDDGDEARKALHTIVSDPAYGIPALSSSQTMANLLKDLLPDAPREVSILVAAAEAGVADKLRDRVSQGMDVNTASAVVAGSFAASTPFRPDACSWAVSEMAAALGLDSGGASVPQGSSQPAGSSQPGSAAPTVNAMPPPPPGFYPPGGYPPGGPPPGGPPPGGYPQAAYPQSAYQPGGYQQGGYQQGGYAQGVYQPPPPGPGYWPQQSPGYTAATKTNNLAVASLVLGILWIFWLGSAVGLVLGLVAIRQINQRNERGRGIAIAGIVLSVLGLAFLLIGIIFAATHPSTSGS